MGKETQLCLQPDSTLLVAVQVADSSRDLWKASGAGPEERIHVAPRNVIAWLVETNHRGTEDCRASRGDPTDSDAPGNPTRKPCSSRRLAATRTTTAAAATAVAAAAAAATAATAGGAGACKPRTLDACGGGAANSPEPPPADSNGSSSDATSTTAVTVAIITL